MGKSRLESLFLPIAVALSKTQRFFQPCYLRLVRERMGLLILPDKAQLRQNTNFRPLLT